MRPAALLGCFALLAAAAGGQGTVPWQRIETPVSESFSRVQIDASDNVWLLGDRIHHRRADGTWAEPAALKGENWTDMVVIRADLMYGVTGLGEFFDVRRAGIVSRFAAQPSCTSYKVVMVARGRTVAAGCPYYSGLAMWRTDGSAAFSVMKVAVQDLSLIGEDDVLAVGMDGVFRARRGGEPVFLRRDERGHSLLWADRTHIVTASDAGAFMHASWDADTGKVGAWTTHTAPRDVSLNRLWGTRADNLFAVGRAGVILHFDGDAWVEMPSGTTADLHTITGGAQATWVAGDAGTLLRLSSERRPVQ